MFSVKPVASNQRKPAIIAALRNFIKPQSSIKPESALTLLVLRVAANHVHHTLATHDLAIAADFLNRCLNLHFSTPRPVAEKPLATNRA
jgi:hypothetical protein